MYLNTESHDYPLTEDQVKAAFPQVSFSAPFIAPAPYVAVTPTTPPPCDTLMQRVIEAPPVLTSNGYAQAWVTVPLSESERAAAVQAALNVIETALDAHLDAVAHSFRFTDRTRLALRAGYPNPWQALGIAFGTWMDTCNSMTAAGLQDVLDGTIPLPSAAEVIAQLPEFVAP